MESTWTYYEPRYWALDPVFSSKMKLNVCEILKLKVYPGFEDVYCYLNHPIGQVHILGDVVSVVRKTKIIKYEVDDGTGVIECAQWRKVDDSDQGLFIPNLGQLVSVFGKVSEFRGAKQLTVTSACPESDPNVEPLFWLEGIELKKLVYSKPFELPPSITANTAMNLQDVMGCELKKWLYEHYSNRPFSLEELNSYKCLSEHCMKTLEQQNPSKADLQQEIKTSISKLASDGIIIPSGTRQQSRQGYYKVLSAEKDLFPVILKYMAKKERSPKAAQLGVPEDWIVEYVKQLDYLRQVSKSTIVDTIASMVEKSLIYPVAPKSYKRV